MPLPKAKLTEEFWAEVEAYYMEGHGFIKCGVKFEVNWQTIRNHLKARGNVKFRPSPAAEYWSKREIIREVEVIREVIVEVPQAVVAQIEPEKVEVEQPMQGPVAPPPPKRRIVGSNHSKTYER